MPAVEMENGRPKIDPATGQLAIFDAFFPEAPAASRKLGIPLACAERAQPILPCMTCLSPIE